MSAPRGGWKWRLGLGVLAAAVAVGVGSAWALGSGAAMKQVEASIDAPQDQPVPVDATVTAIDRIAGVLVMEVEWTQDSDRVTTSLPAAPGTREGEIVTLFVDLDGDTYSTLGGIARAAVPGISVAPAVRDRVATLATWLWGLGFAGLVLAAVLVVVGFHHLVPSGELRRAR